MEKTFEGMVPETELKELTDVKETESGAGVPVGPIIEAVTALLCPSSACTSRCGK